MLGAGEVEAACPPAHAGDLMQCRPTVDGGVRIRAMVEQHCRSLVILIQRGQHQHARAVGQRGARIGAAGEQGAHRIDSATPHGKPERRELARRLDARRARRRPRATPRSPHRCSRPPRTSAPFARRAAPSRRRRRRPRATASSVGTSPVRAAVINSVSPSAKSRCGSAPASSSARIAAHRRSPQRDTRAARRSDSARPRPRRPRAAPATLSTAPRWTAQCSAEVPSASASLGSPPSPRAVRSSAAVPCFAAASNDASLGRHGGGRECRRAATAADGR